MRNRHHFAYADGKPYFPFGTTCYAWTHQPLDMQRQTLETMRTSGFNKLRMAVFPKHYIFNENEPLYDVYERRDDGELDFDRPNVVAFRHFETQVAALGNIGIEADVIIFHPYDRWGYCAMSADQDDRYVRYLVARLGAFRNVWWSLANEYDFLIDVKPIARWDRFFHIIEENDPARHPKSIHNGEETMNFDHRKPWVDHVCIQNWDVKRTADWRREWGKPIVNDELEYEGDISLAWGDLTAQELTHRFWVTVTRGGYARTRRMLRSSRRPALVGQGRRFTWGELEARRFPPLHHRRGCRQWAHSRTDDEWPWQRVSLASEGDIQADLFRGASAGALGGGPAEGRSRPCEVDIIDAWNMTIAASQARSLSRLSPASAARGANGGIRQPPAAFAVGLPAKPYQAIRIRPQRGPTA